MSVSPSLPKSRKAPKNKGKNFPTKGGSPTKGNSKGKGGRGEKKNVFEGV